MHTDLNKAKEIFTRHKLRFEEIENASIREHLENGDYYILTTQGHCDCGTILGSEYRGDAVSESERVRYRTATIEKLRKKGWSQTKIDRWLKEADLNEAKEQRSEDLAHQSNLTFVSDWTNFIEDFLSSKAASRIGILLHMYDGPLNGRIKLKGIRTTPLSKLTEDTLLKMEEDVICEFVSK